MEYLSEIISFLWGFVIVFGVGILIIIKGE